MDCGDEKRVSRTEVESITQLPIAIGARGSTVVEALCYKPEGRGFDSRWCH
jgi:hypothetical protein